MQIKKIASTNSTNSVLKADKNAREGYVIVADEQTEGRGMGQNYWESEAGKNITGSILLKPHFLAPQRSFLLSMAVSIGIINYLENIVPEVKIKWPNDIYFKDKKLAGILIGNEFTSREVKRSIVGIGLNVNQQKFKQAPNPTSIKQITGKYLDLDKTTEKMFKAVFEQYRQLKNNNISKTKQIYHELLLGLNTPLKFEDSKGIFTGIIRRVAEDGQIFIEDKQKNTRSYYFKEVKMHYEQITKS